MHHAARFLGLLLFIAGLSFSARAHSDASARYVNSRSLYLGGGLWLHPEQGGHGIGLFSYDIEKMRRGAHFGASINTDTLRLRYDRIRFAGGLVEVGGDLAGEAVFAGLLTDYYREGRLEEDLGFSASYVRFGGYVKLNLPRRNYLSLSLHGRRWFFSKRDQTADALVLPPEAWVLEPRLTYTYWDLEPEESLWRGHRLFPRIVGVAFGLQAGVDWRSKVAPWGALDAGAFDAVDPRNNPEQTAWMLRQWMRLGARLGSRWRMELLEAAAWGWGEDDLTRDRLGGLNPYVFPIAGAPWAAYLANRYLGAEASVRLRFGQAHEVGVMVQDVVMEDVDREGDFHSFGNVLGFGALLDMRFGESLQLDLRGGYTPSLPGDQDGGQFAVYAGLGFGF